jgi:F-type H+-transporting ATPase subunit b
VTGPYVFGVGLLTYLLSKEIWIVEHGFSHFVSFWVVFYIIARKYGKKIGEFADQVGEAQLERHWHKPMKKVIAQSEEIVKENEKLIWCEEGQKYLFEAKRENVDLQLESAFRQRQLEVYDAVKKRLDYQLEVDNAHRRIEQQHMVHWIVEQVVKGITPQQEKDSLVKCIQDLKSLAAQKPAMA